MKRLLSAVLAFSLLGATAASAAPRGHGGYSRGYHGGHNAGGALIGLGIGLLALSALSSSNRDYYEGDYYDRGYYAPPPPPPRGYYGDRYNGYDDRGYGYGR